MTTITARPGHPDFLDLPWNQPLIEWSSRRMVELIEGIHRNVVRFVAYGNTVYALKELPERLAVREYELLRDLADRSVPVVEAVGVATDRRSDHGEELMSVVITQHLAYSLPYRALFSEHTVDHLRGPLVDALTGLLVRLHLGGFFWGDCSLSNTLFRRDAGTLAAYLVDAETGELHEQLSDGQRAHDLDLARVNIAGELIDLSRGMGQDHDEEVFDAVDELERRYRALWDELTKVEVIAADERHRITSRLRRLNELGFDVEEIRMIEQADGVTLRFQPNVVEPGHHRRRLLELTGLWVEENQARRLLNDLAEHRAEMSRVAGGPVPEAVAAYDWRTRTFEPVLAGFPRPIRGAHDDAELYHQLLERRWFLSEAAGTDVGTDAAVASLIELLDAP